ncbi:MAG: hypothetical protein A2580_06940 [Hydrogenophilales bacterium RIFOXYD1_FULL_62_11]|nr:MAG: hypothetical protein A2580_06940 [Hydrogenophilales bacterium RIFOXYD1_FULL_62_11]
MADLAPALPPLFPEDRGALAYDSRLALCKLLTGPCIDPDSPLWPPLLRDEAEVRSRLAEVFLDLVIDRERKVAFTRPAETGELDVPVLQRSTPLSYLESVLLLHLRQVLVDADTRGERAVVEESELLEVLGVYAPGAGADQVLATKRISAAIDKMRKNTILQGIRGDDRRFEVSPTLRLLFPAEEVAALAGAYQALASGNAASQSSEDDDE